MTVSAEKLEAEIVELRRELAEVAAMLRASLARRRSKRAEAARAPEPAPEVRESVRKKMVRAAAKGRGR